MDDKEYLLKLVYAAFLDIRVASNSQDSYTCFVISDVFHNVPLQILNAEKGITSYDNIIKYIENKCKEKNCTAWFDNAKRNIGILS